MKYFKNKNYDVFIGCFRIFVFGLKRFIYLQMLLVWAHDGCQEWSRIFFTFQDHMSSPWFWYGSFFSTLSFPSFALKLLFIFCCFSSHLCCLFCLFNWPLPHHFVIKWHQNYFLSSQYVYTFREIMQWILEFWTKIVVNWVVWTCGLPWKNEIKDGFFEYNQMKLYHCIQLRVNIDIYWRTDQNEIQTCVSDAFIGCSYNYLQCAQTQLARDMLSFVSVYKNESIQRVFSLLCTTILSR